MKLAKFKSIFLAFCLVFFLISLLVDLLVTYTYFKASPSFFYKAELNREFVDFLFNGTFPFGFVFLNLLVFTLPISSYYLELKYKRDIFDYLLMISLIVLIGYGAMHFVGGFSWII